MHGVSLLFEKSVDDPVLIPAAIVGAHVEGIAAGFSFLMTLEVGRALSGKPYLFAGWNRLPPPEAAVLQDAETAG